MKETNGKRAGKGNGCPLYKKCGGCQLQNMTYREQLSYKQAKAIKHLGRFGRVREIIPMEDPRYYRNKVQAAFGFHRGKIISGVYQSSSHHIVPVDTCLLEDQTADKIITDIRGLLPKHRLTAYNEDTGRGFLRHVLVKRGFATGEVMVVLVTGSHVFPGKNAFVSELLGLHPEITTLIWNINSGKTSLVLGQKETVLFGNGYIEDILCSKRFRISAKSFYQINPVQTEKLYNTAIDFAGLTGKETVLDAYCGIGTIGLVAGDKAHSVIGVELNPDAVRDAVMNAKLNKAQNIRFICADAGKFMVDMAKSGEKIDVVFMDPPRKGSDMPFLKSLVTLKPEKVVYISCNIETQERDLNYLCRNGYQVKKIQPVDMFPHTGHVETVVLLSRKNIEETITIKIDVSSLDMKLPHTATYDEIKSYVWDKYGMRVKTLYISQIKAKYGIKERDNYNKGNKNSKTPQCPIEKEKAIVEAFKHFGMI
ncbi:MAG: 23S rRNA (uracil(1939)-C(5))-methyltransferase RlmD [Oscillospiraceae bacterium]|nr:23S rRNA (uracil(1939)-C(5))-methyltransferase RlmD [Oscillospiraceae bacterium]